MTYKPRLLFILITIAVTNAFGQAPVITHVDKYVNGNAQRVTISGSNFGNTLSNIVVWFGGVQGEVETVTEQTIEVKVPAGATYESIVVTDKSTNKSAWSKGEFQLSYGGNDPIALANLVVQSDLDAESGLYDLCMCDLDGDGLNDIAASNSGGVSAPANGVSVFLNTSTAGASFVFAPKLSFFPNTKTLNIKCGDLDGDGKKDLIISEADPGTRIFILRNTSTTGSLSFTAQNLSLTGKSPKRIDVIDLDGDGRPEIVATDQNTGNKDILILPNTSSAGSISFDTAIPFPVPSTGSDGLALQDIDDDNKPEIIISQTLSSNGNVYVYHNKSTLGNFNFNEVIKADIAPATPNNTGAPVNVRVGDIDGDSKADIVTTHFLASKISVLLNQSTATEVKFGPPVFVSTDVFPFGVDLGDIDGDGKLDVVVASLTGPVTEINPKSLTILNNTSTPGTVSFAAALTKPTTYVNRNVVVGDLDGDSKPDIAYASVDDNTRGVPASKISFFRNKSCILPKITPDGSITVCSSFPLELTSTVSASATYNWQESGTDLGDTDPNYTPSVSGSYTVDLTSDGCTKTSNVVSITVATGAALAPAITNNSPLCEGGTINLAITTPVVNETYNWKGPEGFSATGTTATRPSYVPAFAGRYEVEVIANGCLAAKGSALVETISLPAFNVALSGSDVVCTGDAKLLSASPVVGNFTYQWSDQNGVIAGATSATYSANATGSYSFKAKSVLYPSCPEVAAESVGVYVASIPDVSFANIPETCKDVLTSFSNKSTVDESADPQYFWEFGDGGTSTDKNPGHIYTALAANLTVKLSLQYRGGACPGSFQRQIKVSAPPTASIITEGGLFEFCSGDSITLAVDGTFTEYKWNTNETTPTIQATEGITYSVQLKNSIGCKVSASRAVTAKPAPDISITAEKNPINLGEQTKLSASDGFDDYSWSPIESLDDPASQTPIAKPTLPTTYKVEVVGANGCPGSATYDLTVILDNPTNLLQIANFFSPNGDLTNAVWSVKPELIAQTCAVTIFDEKGLKVYEAKPYMNDWDGTSNGKKLPDGVYYYMIRCDGDSGTRSGSITILR